MIMSWNSVLVAATRFYVLVLMFGVRAAHPKAVHHGAGGSNAPRASHHFMPQPPPAGGGRGVPGHPASHLNPNAVISPSAPYIPGPGTTETMPGDLSSPKAGQKPAIFDRLESTPKDITDGIRTLKRQHSSRFDISDQKQRELEKLPGFQEIPLNRRQELFMQKIEQCNIIFDFDDQTGNMKSKEIKRLALHELLDYVENNRWVITEPIYPRVVDMFSKNIFRPLQPPVNPQSEAFDPEEDEPVLEVAWPHVQVVYEFFIRFIESQDFNTSIAKAHIDHQFVLQVSRQRVNGRVLSGDQYSSSNSLIRKTLGNDTSSRPFCTGHTANFSTYGRTSGGQSTMFSSNSSTRLNGSTE